MPPTSEPPVKVYAPMRMSMAVVPANGAPLSGTCTKFTLAILAHAANALLTAASNAPAPYCASMAVRRDPSELVLPAANGKVVCASLKLAPSVMQLHLIVAPEG